MNGKLDTYPMAARTGSLTSAFLAIVTIVTTILAAPDAVATDRKNFHGTTCQPYSASNGSYLNYASGIYNSSGNSYLYVTCPLVRDNVMSSNGISSASVTVSQSPSTNYRFTCTLYSKNLYGNTVDYSSRTLSHYETGYRRVYFDLDESTIRTGTYVLYCRIPPYSRINYISLVEY